MNNLNDLDLSDAAPLSEGFTAIPGGDYPLYMESSERKPFGTEPNVQDKLECVFVVASGEHEGAKMREWFAMWDKSLDKNGVPKSAKEKGKFVALCEATIRQPHPVNGDSASLHGKLFMATVLNEPQWDKATQTNDPSKRTNKISWKKGSVRSMNAGAGAVPAAQAQQPNAGTAPQPQAAPVVPGQGKAPWKR